MEKEQQKQNDGKEAQIPEKERGGRVICRRALKVLSLFLAILLFLAAAWKGLYIHRNYDEDRVTGFFHEPENSLDVVMIGASDISRAYCPGLAYAEYGIKSYLFAINGDAVQVWQAQLDETLRRQKPDAVVIEVNGALYSLSEEPQYHMYQSAVERMALHLPMLSPMRISMIQRYVEETGDIGSRLRLLLPLYEFHANQPGGIRSAISTIYDNLHFGADNGGVLTLRGFETIVGSCTVGELIPDFEKSNETEELDPAYEKALRKFLSHCRKRYPDTNIIFVRTPHLFEKTNTRMQTVFRRTNRIAQILEEYGYSLVNCEKKKAEIGLDAGTDFYDANHLNVSGMEKFTRWFSGYLLEHGVTPREPSSEQKEQWEHTAHFTELLLDYYEELQGQGVNGQDLYESTDLLEILNERDRNAEETE